MNYMEQVAQMLGVELDEEFYIGDSQMYKFTKDGLYFYSKLNRCWISTNIGLRDILIGFSEITKKPILDEVEKEYLSGVIKSFRDKVKCIVKRDYEMSYENEYIFIVFNDDGCMQIKMCFPSFKKGTMYKGMEINKEYSLEDLGL